MTLIFLVSSTLFVSEMAYSRSKFTPPDPLYSLRVISTPKNAVIKIMNIRPSYYHGIKLSPGDYRIQVSAFGYQLKKLTVQLRHQNKKVNIQLSKSRPTPTNNHTDRLKIKPAKETTYSITRGYKRFLRHSDQLKGVSFLEEKEIFSKYCKRYAKLAVRQAKRRLVEGCSNIITPLHNDAARQWSLNRIPQAAWCKAVSSHATAKETIYREKRLKDCLK